MGCVAGKRGCVVGGADSAAVSRQVPWEIRAKAVGITLKEEMITDAQKAEIERREMMRPIVLDVEFRGLKRPQRDVLMVTLICNCNLLHRDTKPNSTFESCFAEVNGWEDIGTAVQTECARRPRISH